jgi:tetratricopeptide (TPR) repeat protein
MGEYQDAITLDPKSPTAYDNLAILQLAKGKREEAEATFKSAVQAAPSSVPARLALANFYWSVGRRDEAETVLKETVALDKDNLTANRALGLFYVATNRVTEAEPYFIALTRKESDEAALTLADYYVIANRKDEARTILRERAKQPKAFAAANIRIASLDATDGHLADAQQRLRDVLEGRAEERVGAAAQRAHLHRRRQARRRTDVRADGHQNDPVSSSAALRVDARRQRRRGQRSFRGRHPRVRQVLKMQSRPTGAVLALAMVYLGRGNPDKATSYAQQALTMDPTVLDAQAILVRADLLRGELSKAKADLEPLQKAQPKSIGVFKLSALIELASNHVDAARAAYERVLTANPNDQEALEALVRLDVGGGKSGAGAAHGRAAEKASRWRRC